MESVLGGTCALRCAVSRGSHGQGRGSRDDAGAQLAAENLGKDVGDLVPDDDYQDAILSYDWRTHRSTGISRGFMDRYGRLYVMKVGGNRHNARLVIDGILYYEVVEPLPDHDGGDAQRYTADNDQINRYGAASTGT